MLVSLIMRFIFLILFSASLTPFKYLAFSQYTIRWVDDFTVAEKKMLEKFVVKVEFAADNELGNYPFTVQLFFHKQKSNSSPVPWAYTERDDYTNSIHLHVDTRFGLDVFLNDWTLAHEWSHLAIPFVGDKYRWFSEGFASFMQWQVLCEMGQMNGLELMNKTKEKTRQIVKYFDNSRTMIEGVKHYQQLRNYPAWYYGGASYFYVVNNELAARNSSLSEIVKWYQKKGNRKESVKELVILFDELSSSSVFSKVLEAYYELYGSDFVKMLKQKTQN